MILYMYIYKYKNIRIYVCVYTHIGFSFIFAIDGAGGSTGPRACLRGAYALRYVAYASLRGQKVERTLQKTAYAGLRGPRFRI